MSAEADRHQVDADAKLLAAEIEVGSWVDSPGRPTRADLVALRKLLHAIRVHVSVVRTS